MSKSYEPTCNLNKEILLDGTSSLIKTCVVVMTVCMIYFHLKKKPKPRPPTPPRPFGGAVPTTGQSSGGTEKRTVWLVE